MESIIGKDFPKKVIPLINNAKNSVRIIVYDWRWYREDPGNPCQLFNMAVVQACRRGVMVQACVNSQDVATPLRENKIDVKIPVSKRLMHTKMILIDDNILVLGSHNFSQNAFTFNLETSVILKDSPAIAHFISFFNSVWNT